MVCHAFANIHPDADEQVIEEWLQANICRCTSYDEIKLTTIYYFDLRKITIPDKYRKSRPPSFQRKGVPD